MVARERVTKIVALTQTIGHHGLDSNSTPELHQYFPSHEMGLSEVETKDYSVQLLSTAHQPHMISRQLKISTK